MESTIFGQSSALESVEFVSILADIEENFKDLFGIELDCFELLLSNQGKDISVQDLSVLIFDSLHGK
ncbi:hypothetical protein [Synechococcus sp. A15-127]|uniref:hypothetical protein n=1 Tax=Synechococcus sp. A15-127 TaxID=1050624 RepID=UPI001645866C|nr:hypothetical protein [Synechococcus sp. A15-127]